MANTNDTFQTAMKLAVVSGLRAAMGPALVAARHRRPERQNLAMAAMGELLIDKMPLVPSRATLPLLLPRAVAGYWVAKTVMEEEGGTDPWAPAVGAAVAAGVATLAPMIRGTLRRVLGVPDVVLGVAEDYLAIRLGSEALGMTMDDVKQIAAETVGEIREQVLPALQSVGAGSM
jgi:hypothetical protein